MSAGIKRITKAVGIKILFCYNRKALWSLQLLHLINNYWAFINLNMVNFNYTSPIWCWLCVFLISMLHIFFFKGGGEHTEYILPTSASFNILLIRISNQRKQLLINLLIWIKYIVQTIILHPWLKECRVSRTN